MRRALDLADRAASQDEVPVGALLVRNGVVLGMGHNQPVSTGRPAAHAEMVALDDAARRGGNYRLPGATLYVTLEPCAMCAGAIVVARIARIVFGASDPRAGACGSVMDVFAHRELNHRPVCLGGVLGEASASRLRGFFRVRR